MSAPAVPPAEGTDIEIEGPGGFHVEIRRVSFEALALIGALAGIGCALGYTVNMHGLGLAGLGTGLVGAALHALRHWRG